MWVIKRLFFLVSALILTSVVIFLMIHWIPGDPAEILAGPGASLTDIEKIRDDFGLNKSLMMQYATWFNKAIHGDFGISFASREPIAPLLIKRFINTFKLSLFGIIFAIMIGIPLGIISAMKQNSLIDVFTMGISVLGISIPIFWLGLILIIIFSVNLGLLPASGSGSFKHLILPGIAIGLNSLALISRMTRSSMLEVIRQDYIRTAEAKGLPSHIIVLKHALKNAMIPIITTIGIQFGYLLGGAVLTENVFVYPGIGRLLIDSISRRDYPVVQACILLIALLFIVINFAVDILYSYLDPRIKY